MAAVVLDTTVLIDLLRGQPDATHRLRSLRLVGDTPHVCAVSVEEVVRGLRPSEDVRTRSLFAGLAGLPLGKREGWQAGEWRREFAAQGRTLSQPDCLIAAAAVSAGAQLATGNPKDFPFAELTVEHWPVGA
jgi:predicted nucleic acid-binding protein